jgi:hypothetical protein
MKEDRTPPQDIQTERSFLGSLIMQNSLISAASCTLRPAAFYLTSHRLIYEAILDLSDDGIPVDSVTLVDALRRAGTLEKANGESYIFELVDAVAVSVNAGSYIKIINEHYLRRKTIAEANNVLASAWDASSELVNLLAGAESLVNTITEHCAAADIQIRRQARVVPFDELAQQFDRHRQYGPTNPGLIVSDFWPRFSQLYRPAKGILQVITGIPKNGKSELADVLSICMAKKHGWKTLFYSPENYPYETHMERLAEKHTGKLFATIGDDEYAKCKEWMRDHFWWIEPSEDTVRLNTLVRIINDQVKADKIDHVVLDPWNEIELEHSERRGLGGEDLGRALTRCRWMARRLNILVTIICHPKNMERAKSGGGYLVPHLYDMWGGSMWPNKVDLGIVIHRHYTKEPYTGIYVRACRNRAHGKHGCVEFRYEHPPGAYVELPAKEPRKKKEPSVQQEDLSAWFDDDNTQKGDDL